MARRKRLAGWRVVARVILTALAVPMVAFLVQWGTGNRGVVERGAVYRSGQLTPAGLRRAIEANGIRTVLNLRGSNPSQDWYRGERAATLERGCTQVDFAMASDLYLSRAQARCLVEVLDFSPRPMLIHCQWGAERTGLAAAFADLLRTGGSVESARGQFSIRHLYLPIKDGLVMSEHVELYARHLKTNGLDHTPTQFRRWVTEAYRPPTPSREEWAADPYPLLIVHRPSTSAVASRPLVRLPSPR